MKILEYILCNLGVPALVTTSLFIILRKWFSSKIDSTFQKKLKTYQQKLDISTEEARFDLQRKIQDFGLYTTKKHSSYMEFHKLLLEADSHVLGLYGLKSIPTYEEYNDIDIKELMEKAKFPKGKIEEILNIISTFNRDTGIKKMREYLRLIEFREAERSIILCKNYYWTSKLYFSTKIEKLSKKYIDKLYRLYNIYQILPDLPKDAIEERKNYGKESNVLKEEIGLTLDKVILEMKKELSIGYYEGIKSLETT